MRGHVINVIIIWSSIFLAMVVLHVNAPNFPIGASIGDSFGGVMLVAVGCFFTFSFGKLLSRLEITMYKKITCTRMLG